MQYQNTEATDDKVYLSRKSCPCCAQSTQQSRLAFASNPPAETLPIEHHSDFAAGYTSERVFFSYFTCQECQARYCHNFYTEAQIKDLYKNQTENMGEVPLSARQKAQEEYAKCLLKHTTGNGGFLEIGADIGLFAEYCAKNSNFNHFWLFEPNLVVHDELHDRLQGSSHTIKEAMWPTKDVPDESISALVLIHVLDHLLDPLAYLNALREKLEPEGVVMTVTHNPDSLLAKVLGKRWPPHALQHPQLYSPSSIKRLYERAGFSIEEVVPAVNYFPIMHLVRGAFSVAGLPNLFPNMMGPIIPINLGNIAVVARKI